MINDLRDFALWVVTGLVTILQLFVGFFFVTDRNDGNDNFVSVNFVDDTIIANTNAVSVFAL